MRLSKLIAYSITSAAIKMEVGIGKPNNFAVRALTISSWAVGSSIGTARRELKFLVSPQPKSVDRLLGYRFGIAADHAGFNDLFCDNIGEGVSTVNQCNFSKRERKGTVKDRNFFGAEISVRQQSIDWHLPFPEDGISI